MTEHHPQELRVPDLNADERAAWNRACSEAAEREANRTIPTGGLPLVFFRAGLLAARSGGSTAPEEKTGERLGARGAADEASMFGLRAGGSTTPEDARGWRDELAAVQQLPPDARVPNGYCAVCRLPIPAGDDCFADAEGMYHGRCWDSREPSGVPVEAQQEQDEQACDNPSVPAERRPATSRGSGPVRAGTVRQAAGVVHPEGTEAWVKAEIERHAHPEVGWHEGEGYVIHFYDSADPYSRREVDRWPGYATAEDAAKDVPSIVALSVVAALAARPSLPEDKDAPSDEEVEAAAKAMWETGRQRPGRMPTALSWDASSNEDGQAETRRIARATLLAARSLAAARPSVQDKEEA